MKSFRTGAFLGGLFWLAVILGACHSEKEKRSRSDSAITAPVDTLGADTARNSPLADTVGAED